MTSPFWTYRSASGSRFEEALSSNPRDSLLAFDFDGTLSRIVPRAEDARMVEESAEALARLARSGVQVAIISGRPIDTLLELSRAAEKPGLASSLIFGHYGAERLDLATGERSSPAPPRGISEAKRELVELLKQYPGATLEDKGLAVAAHFRNSSNRDVDFESAGARVREIAEHNELTVEPGRYVWELRGPTVTKGDALRELVIERRPSSVMFAGDDLGDIAAFEALAQIGNSEDGPVTCAVVARSNEAAELEKYADILCEGPGGIAAWLTALAASISADPAS
ncbi:MAG: trehalose-phosphatase [Scrofimicrobium sp.]